MFQRLIRKETKLSLIGLGYVGLPIALEFARKLKVVGFDVREDRVRLMKKGIDPSKEISSDSFASCDIEFSSSLEDLRSCSFHIIAVPTPVDRHNLPDLSPVIKASETIGKILKKGDYVVYESTVYPGCTEEDCVPVLEKFSGLKSVIDFKVGFSPERINPGDKEHSLVKIKKVVSGCDEESLNNIADVYGLIISAGIHRAQTIKVAEAAKIIENTQRDVNIALMNELSIIFNRMDINTYDVLEAAGTKWNFLRFYPGLVGGHCIGVDPYYLAFKAEEYNYHPQVIKAGRSVNDNMGFYIAGQLVKKLIAAGKNVRNTKVLIMGATFKEDVTDIRNSKVADVISELKTYGVNIEVIDPAASSAELMHEYGFDLIGQPSGNYDAVVIAVAHKEYLDLDEDYFRSIAAPNIILVDVKGIYRHKIKELTYWSL
ncbi:MAG: nucleotide sugar dehydrogenase [Bacteroidia bacterium]|nr:nucleotide sugar dehydrogenase [Bacteroidia bacterium]